jgi:hypothetical protein
MHLFETYCIENDVQAIVKMIQNATLPEWIYHTRYKATPLFFVFKHMQLLSIQSILSYLLTYGCSPNLCYDSDSFQVYSLYYLLERRPPLALIKLLLEYGADPEVAYLVDGKTRWLSSIPVSSYIEELLLEFKK